MLQKSIPFYIQITRILRRELVSGVYPENSRMPDENTLAARFGVSKDVIRVSMRLLAKEGLVKAIRSKGTFVCERPKDQAYRFVLMSFHGSLHMDAIRNGIEPVIPEGCDFVLKCNTLFKVEDEKKILESLDLSSIKAFIAAPVYNNEKDNTKIYAELVKQGVPLLIIDHSLPDLQADEVVFDEYGATVEFMRAALQDIGDAPAIFINSELNDSRINNMRVNALNDVWNESAAGQPDKKRIFFNIRLKDDVLDDILEQNMHEICKYPNIIVINSQTAAKIYKKMQQMNVQDKIRKIYTIGDILRGDTEFNRKLFCYYRLFDELTPHIREILDIRLNSPEPPPTPIRYAIHYKYMSCDEAHDYFTSKMI